MSVSRSSDFELGPCLANGGFGSVRLARHKASNAIFAIKLMTKAGVRWQSVVKEVALHRRLAHPNVVRLHSYFETPAYHCLLLHFAAGGNLHHHIDRQTILEEKAVRYFRQIVSGVDYLHGMRIVHRDLKPLNILLDNGDVALIADFGSAVDLLAEQPIGNAGTLPYSAPEAKAGEEHYGSSADVWSLGATLVHMTTGQLPTDELLMDEAKREAATPAHFTADCRAMMSTLLRVSPDARPTAHEVLGHRWLFTE